MTPTDRSRPTACRRQLHHTWRVLAAIALCHLQGEAGGAEAPVVRGEPVRRALAFGGPNQRDPNWRTLGENATAAVPTNGVFRIAQPGSSDVPSGVHAALDPAADFGGNPLNGEWMFETRFRVAGEPACNGQAYLVAGLADEAGGKTVLFRLMRSADKRFQVQVGRDESGIALAPTAGSGASPDFRDGAFHTFRIVKRFGIGGVGNMRVGFYVDGARWTSAGWGHHYLNQFPDAATTNLGVVVSLKEGGALTADVDYVAFGPPDAAVPGAVIQEPAVAAAGATTLNLWPRAYPEGTGLLGVTPNRFYELSARLGNSGRDRAVVRFRIAQFRADRECAEPPDYLSPEVQVPPGAEEVPFRWRFYVRTSCNRVKVFTRVEGASDAVQWKNLTLVGGGPYRPSDGLLQPEVIPPLDAVRERVLALPAVRAQVRTEEGRSRLRVNGERVAPAFYNGTAFGSGFLEGGHFGDFARAGVRVHVAGYEPGFSAGGRDGGGWSGPGRYDFSKVDDLIWRVLRSDPEGYLHLLVWMDPYRAWGAENQDDICRNDRGEPGIGDAHLKRWGGEPSPNERFLPSLYSAKVRTDGADMLRHLVRYLKDKGLDRRIIGFAIVGFNDGQFVNWAHWDRERLDDYAPCAQSAFRDWLRRRYSGEVAALQKAWARPEVNFDTATIPAPQRRRGNGLFVDWRKDADVVDYGRFYVEGPVELMEAYARVVKEETGGQKVVSIYYASPLNAAQSGSGLGRVLESPYFDILHCPAHYGPRLPGYVGGHQSACGSVNLHGRIFLTEQDWRSWLSGSGPSEGWDVGVGRAPDAWSMTQMVRRESGMMLAQGQGTWWLELAGNAFNDPGIMAGIAEATRAFDRDLAQDGWPEADVAFFAGEDSLAYLTHSPAAVDYRWQVLRHGRDNWNMSGVPYHVYVQSDIADPRLPDYRVYIFLASQKVGPEERKAIEKLKRNGKTLVFLHAPNIVGAADPASGVREITGIEVARAENLLHAGRWTGGNHRLLRGLLPGGELLPTGIGGLGGLKPLRMDGFVVTDPAAVPLCAYAESGQTAIAVRDFGTWRSVYCGIPILDPQFLNNLADAAGAWCSASPGDAVYASQHILTIHALAPGPKHLRLRRPARVLDLATGRQVTACSDRLELDMPWGETRWFLLQPRSWWDRLLHSEGR